MPCGWRPWPASPPRPCLAGCGGQDAATPAATTPAPTSSSTTTTPDDHHDDATTTTHDDHATAHHRRPSPGRKPSTTRPGRADEPTPAPRPRPSRPSPRSRPSRPAPAGCRPGSARAQVVLVDSSGAGATVRACRRTGSGYTTELGPYYGHVGPQRGQRQQARGRPAGPRPASSRCAAASAPTPTPACGSAAGCGSTPRTSGSTTPAPPLQHPPAQAGQRPLGQRGEAAEPAGLQLRPGDRLQRGAHARARDRRSSSTSTRVAAPRAASRCPPQPLLAVLRWERAGAVIAIR